MAGTAYLKLQCAERVRDAFDRIAQAVCEVVGRVDGPLLACAKMASASLYAVQSWVSHMHVRRSHVYLGPQNADAILKIAFSHFLK